MMKLDYYQAKAALQNSPYSIIIAGAGTGKTYTLIGRIKYLMSIGIKAEEILIISYTNETVDEFKRKVVLLLNIEIKVMTFHKLAMYILESANISFCLCDEQMLEFIVTEFIENFCLRHHILRNCILKIYSSFFGIPTFKAFKKLKEKKKFLI